MNSAICRAEIVGLADVTGLPTELVEFTRRQIVNATMYRGDEQRAEGRHLMMLPVRAVEVNENHAAIGEPFDLITRDLSASAIGLVHTDPIDGERLALNFHIAGTDVNVVVNLIWSRPMGPFYGAAGKFVTKLNGFPQTQVSSSPAEHLVRDRSPGTSPARQHVQ